jgi:hypothetical protein
LLRSRECRAKLLEIANSVEAWDGRIYIELINGPLLFGEGHVSSLLVF